MIVYKLTDQKLQTYGGCQWEPGVPRETSGEGNLCGPGWLHYYHDPLLAVLLHPLHGNFFNPILWEAEAEGLHRDDRGLKGGSTKLTLLRQIDLPQFTTEQRVRFGILCAKAVYADPAWNAWADGWLSGKDRSSAEAAKAEAMAAWTTVEAWEADSWIASMWAAARAAERAARAARDGAVKWAWTEVAEAAERATAAVEAEAKEKAAKAAARGDEVAEGWAAAAAGARAAWAAAAGTPLDLIAIAREALKGDSDA